jgi:DNA-directed RNA polymerase subunit RPC12/RpoP
MSKKENIQKPLDSLESLDPSEPLDVQGIEKDKKGKIKIKYTPQELEYQKKQRKLRVKANQLKNLSGNKNRTEAELKEIVQKKNLLKELEVHKLFTDKKEQKLAKDLADKYLIEFTPRTVSDKNNLKAVIYLEVLQYRLQAVMNELTAEGATAIPLNLVDSIHKNLKELSANKEKLGLIGKDKEQADNDGFRILQNLKEKFKVWGENNQGSRTLVCPCCGEMILLKIRMDKWIPQKHPFFKDRFLANKHLIRLYLQQKLSKEDIASVLGSSPDYIEWLVETLWMTDPEYRKEIRKIEGKHLDKLERKLQEKEAKDTGDEPESGELESGEIEGQVD